MKVEDLYSIEKMAEAWIGFKVYNPIKADLAIKAVDYSIERPIDFYIGMDRAFGKVSKLFKLGGRIDDERYKAFVCMWSYCDHMIKKKS